MRKMLLIAGLGIALALSGCGDRAKDLYETAQLEERQYNPDNAAKLYRQIIDRHPRSPYAEQARERLAELEK
jgi:outer membrane protein assembly factor BamD (BamD/ComL family)